MGKNVVVFAGSEVSQIREKYYFEMAYEMGKLLAQNGFVTANGGGPGLMNETSRGALENGGDTIGICLNLEGRVHSSYLKTREEFDHLRQRQEKLVSLAHAFIALPGGIGTYYEIFEVLSLKRKKDIDETMPLILLSDYFDDLRNMIVKMETEGFLEVNNNTLYQIANSPLEAIHILKRYYGI